MQFDYSISHVPGKLLYTADTLSRVPLQSEETNEYDQDMESFLQAIISHLPASPDHVQDYKDAQARDPICSQLLAFTQQEWPTQHQLRGDIL